MKSNRITLCRICPTRTIILKDDRGEDHVVVATPEALMRVAKGRPYVPHHALILHSHEKPLDTTRRVSVD